MGLVLSRRFFHPFQSGGNVFFMEEQKSGVEPLPFCMAQLSRLAQLPFRLSVVMFVIKGAFARLIGFF